MLDWQGLGGLWREGLGAQKALIALERGEKVGYQSHPQLDRFKATEDPVEYIVAYLWGVLEEANEVRGYHYNGGRIAYTTSSPEAAIPVTRGQMDYELGWLGDKLAVRAPAQLERLEDVRPHPLFEVVPGDVEHWERRK